MSASYVPTTMRAVRYEGPYRVTVVDRPVPQPGPGEVLLRVRAVGICGSDLHWYRGDWEQLATIPGHEVGATVAALGAGVAGLEVGQPVCLEPLVRCNECSPCRDGEYNHCERFTLLGGERDGGMAEYELAPGYAVVPLPPAVSSERGNLVETVAVGLHGLRAAEPAAGAETLVIGAGSVGLAATLAAADLGLRVSVTARYPHQARAARMLGASTVLEGDETPPESSYDLVVDTIGTTQAIALAQAAARNRGTIVALASGRVEIELERLILKGHRLLGALCYCTHGGRPDFPYAAEILARHPQAAEVMITHRFPLKRAAEAFAIANDKSSGSIKVVVEP